LQCVFGLLIVDCLPVSRWHTAAVSTLGKWYLWRLSIKISIFHPKIVTKSWFAISKHVRH
jgi:hypothetical protein